MKGTKIGGLRGLSWLDWPVGALGGSLNQPFLFLVFTASGWGAVEIFIRPR